MSVEETLREYGYEGFDYELGGLLPGMIPSIYVYGENGMTVDVLPLDLEWLEAQE